MTGRVRRTTSWLKSWMNRTRRTARRLRKQFAALRARWCRRAVDPRRRRGMDGEAHAARWLEARGYRTLIRNARFAGVEVDLVMATPDGFGVAIIEVKTRGRRTIGWALPKSAQRRRLRRAARAVARRWPGRPIRCDVVIVVTRPVGADGAATARSTAPEVIHRRGEIL